MVDLRYDKKGAGEVEQIKYFEVGEQETKNWQEVMEGGGRGTRVL